MKTILLRVLVNSPLQWFFQWRMKKRLRVLCYHEINDEGQFTRQLAWLQQRYDIISVRQLEDHCYEGAPLPEKPLLITFDDGDVSLYNKGLAIFKKYRIPATLFIITSLIDSEQPYWWEEIRHYAPPRWSAKEKEGLVWEWKKLHNSDRLAAIAQLKQKSEREVLRSPQLKSSQLYELEAAGATIANHTHTHPLLDRCSEEEVRADLEKADAFFSEKHLGGRRYLAYPNGNFSDQVEQQLKSFGFRLAFLFDHQINQRKLNPLRISRLSVNTHTTMDQFKLILSGAHSFLLSLKRYLS